MDKNKSFDLDSIIERIGVYIIILICIPFDFIFYLKDRADYKRESKKLNIGDYFIVEKDSEYIKSYKMYKVETLENNRIGFKNRKLWFDYIDIHSVKKVIFIDCK